MRVHSVRAVSAAILASVTTLCNAQNDVPSLEEVVVEQGRSVPEKLEFPGTSESVTAKQISESVNVINTEDVVRVSAEHTDSQAPYR